MATRSDRFIASCASCEDFWQQTRQLSKAEMGRAFERLVQLYLQTAPEYRTILRHVWLLRDVPARVRKRLELPHPDEGIDLIALDRHGEYWAIQAKFRSQRDQPLTRRELGTFTGHATLREVERYTKDADQLKLARAAMARTMAADLPNSVGRMRGSF